MNNFKYFCGNKIKYRFSLFNLIRIKTSFLFFIKLYRCEHFVFAKFYRKEVNSTKEKNAKKNEPLFIRTGTSNKFSSS